MLDDHLRVADVRDLHAFSLAGRVASLTAVAAEMGESKATVSRRLTRLERALGVALVHRSPRGVELTDDGRAYLARIAQILELLGEANGAASTRSAPSGPLRVSVPPGLGDALAPILASFSAAYPQIVLVVDASTRFVDLAAERFDVAIRATVRLADSSLVAVRVREPATEGILVCSPVYAKRHGVPRRLDQLATHRIVALGDSAAGYRVPVLRRGSTKVIQLALPAAISVSDLGLVRSLVLEGAGIACLPHLGVQRDLDEKRLVHVLPSYLWPTGGLFLLHRGGTYVSPKVRAFLDHVKAALTRVSSAR